MKSRIIWFLFVGLFAFASCDKENLEDEKCDAEKWEEAYHPRIQFLWLHWEDTFVVDIPHATDLTFRGRVLKPTAMEMYQEISLMKRTTVLLIFKTLVNLIF